MGKSNNVTAAKPKVGGAAYRAKLGTALPTDAKTALDAAFVAQGYISTDGLTNASELSVEEVKAWGGDVVYNAQTEKKDTFKFKLIEGLNVEVLKTVHGGGNVNGSLAEGVTVNVNSTEVEPSAWVFEIVLKGGVAKRVVIPSASITSIGEVKYADNEPVGYELTLSATPDEAGNTHYEYLVGKGA